LRTDRPRPHAWLRPLLAVLGSAAVAAVGLGGAGAAASARAVTAWQWYKADVHVHSSGVSPDAAQDLGILTQTAKRQGLNAVFVTDHGSGSNQPIGRAIANHIAFAGSFGYWKTATYGSVSSWTNALASSPAPPGGTSSLHLAATSGGYGEAITWYKRGPNLRSGHLILKFSVYPTRIDPGSGVYVSVAVGGDSTLRDATGTGCDSTSGKSGPPNGYTTAGGVISPGKNNVFVWQLGTPRSPSSDPNARLFTHQLSYTLGTWNSYAIDVTQALAQIPAADRPSGYDALVALKMVAAANGGTADAYFGAYHLDASAPVPSADEFIYREKIIHQYDTSTFKVFPGLEAGSREHVSRFDYDITKPSQYEYYKTGPPSIPATHALHYPAQLDHPGFPGGAKPGQAIASKAFGADLMEAVPRGKRETMIGIWDGILAQGARVLGTWSSDSHRTETFGDSTAVWAPSLAFDPLIRSLYEGRTYMAANSFAGHLLLSPVSSPQEPYPARYPIYVSPSAATASLTMSVSAGLAGGTVNWIQRGAEIASDPVTQPSYQATKTISLSTLPTYVRTEVRNPKNQLVAMSEPIFFVGVAGVPAQLSYHVAGVTTADGKQYDNAEVKGISASSWQNKTSTLSLTLTNPEGSAVETVVSTGGSTPTGVVVDGADAARAGSLAAYHAGAGTAYFYDATARQLYVRDRQAARASSVQVDFGKRSAASVTCALVPKPSSAWVRGRIYLTLRTGAVHGVRGKVTTPAGKVLGAASAAKSGQLKLPVNTRLLPSNRRSRILVVVFVNGIRSCSAASELNVDNVAPSLALVRFGTAGNAILVTLKTSETVRISVTAQGRQLTSRTVRGGRNVTLRLPRRSSFTVAMVDRAGNRSAAALKVTH
jgi:hypothetical protein